MLSNGSRSHSIGPGVLRRKLSLLIKCREWRENIDMVYHALSNLSLSNTWGWSSTPWGLFLVRCPCDVWWDMLLSREGRENSSSLWSSRSSVNFIVQVGPLATAKDELVLLASNLYELDVFVMFMASPTPGDVRFSSSRRFAISKSVARQGVPRLVDGWIAGADWIAGIRVITYFSCIFPCVFGCLGLLKWFLA